MCIQGERRGFRSDLILDLFTFHISKKTRNSPRSYGYQIGALGLCTAAVITKLPTFFVLNFELLITLSKLLD